MMATLDLVFCNQNQPAIVYKTIQENTIKIIISPFIKNLKNPFAIGSKIQLYQAARQILTRVFPAGVPSSVDYKLLFAPGKNWRH